MSVRGYIGPNACPPPCRVFFKNCCAKIASAFTCCRSQSSHTEAVAPAPEQQVNINSGPHIDINSANTLVIDVPPQAVLFVSVTRNAESQIERRISIIDTAEETPFQNETAGKRKVTEVVVFGEKIDDSFDKDSPKRGAEQRVCKTFSITADGEIQYRR